MTISSRAKILWGVTVYDFAFAIVCAVIALILPLVVKPILMLLAAFRRHGIFGAHLVDARLVSHMASPVVIFCQSVLCFAIVKHLTLPVDVSKEIVILTVFLIAFSSLWLFSRLIDTFTDSMNPDVKKSLQFGGVLTEAQPDMIAAAIGKIFKGFMFLVVFTIVLGYYGIPILPMIATLSVVGIAIAFGVQNTLQNIFAAIQIFLDCPFELGDYIALPNGKTGYVVSIGLRVCKFKLQEHAFCSVPNSQLVGGPIINYFRQDKNRIQIDFSVLAHSEGVRPFLSELQQRLILFPCIAETMTTQPETVAFVTGTDGVTFQIRVVLNFLYGTSSSEVDTNKALLEYRQVVKLGLDGYIQAAANASAATASAAAGTAPPTDDDGKENDNNDGNDNKGNTVEMTPLHRQKTEPAHELVLTDRMLGGLKKPGTWDYWAPFVIMRQEMCIEITRLMSKYEVRAPGTVMTVTVGGQVVK